jgi:ParB family transcriptional regulator, chromosome partitioning protein
MLDPGEGVMTTQAIPSIPIAEIKIINPRPRNKSRFDQVVTSMGAVGYKTPITVAPRPMDGDGTQYDLVCGQGRLEAFLALGETTIPAIITTASREEQFLMSLVENLARRPPSNLALLQETRRLREAGYNTEQVASKLGFAPRYIATIVALLDKGEEGLLAMVEAGKIPLTVAAEIAQGKSGEIQRALAEAYESGDLRGAKLRAVRALIQRREAGAGKTKKKPRAVVNGATLAKEFREHTRTHRKLVQKAGVVDGRLALVAAGCRKLFADDNFVTLLRVEHLTEFSDRLIELTQEV